MPIKIPLRGGSGVTMFWRGGDIAILAANATEDAARKGVRVIARHIRANLDPHRLTGETSRNIRAKSIPGGGAVTSQPQIIPLELGHDIVLGGKKGRGGKKVGTVGAVPTVVPAMEQSREEVIRILLSETRPIFTGIGSLRGK